MKDKKSKKKITLGQIVMRAIYIVVSAALTFFVTANLANFAEVYNILDNFIVYIICLYLIIFLSMIVSVIIHELGHLVFGLISGYEFVSFRVFSFMWIKLNGKIRLKRFSLVGTGGQCLMTYPGNDADDAPVTLFNLGGSLLNIISALIMFVSAVFVNNPFITALLCSLAAMNVAAGLANGIPLKLGALNNDGYNAFSLKKNYAARKAFLLQLKVNELASKGYRLKDMPEEWFELPDEEQLQNSLIATIGVFACNRLMDQHRFEEADALMNYYLESENAIVDIHRNLMICDLIYCEVIGENRGEVVDAMFTKDFEAFLKSMSKNLSVIRTQYAYALLSERNKDNADKYLNLFEKVSKNHPHTSDIELERELLEIANQKEK